MAADNFDRSLNRVLVHEGGYSNHPSDPGGPTNWGITIGDARRYWKRYATADDVRAMPKSTAMKIYRTQYWDAMRCDELPFGLDYAVMDYGVNSGTARAIKVLERLVFLPADGKPDDSLIKSIAYRDTKDLIAKLCDERLRFLRGLKTWPVFGVGWGRRVAEVRAAALSMAAYLPAPQPRPSDKTAKAPTPVTPSDVGKSKTIQSVLAQIAAALAAAGSFLADWKVAAVICTALIIGLALFVGRERIKRMIGDQWR